LVERDGVNARAGLSALARRSSLVPELHLEPWLREQRHTRKESSVVSYSV